MTVRKRLSLGLAALTLTGVSLGVGVAAASASPRSGTSTPRASHERAHAPVRSATTTAARRKPSTAKAGTSGPCTHMGSSSTHPAAVSGPAPLEAA